MNAILILIMYSWLAWSSAHIQHQPEQQELLLVGGVCDQKTSKFFVSYQEESMAGHMSVNGVY
jgi:hypothetical protein